MSELSPAQLRAMVDEATVDCEDVEEQVGGLYAMIEEHLAVPFETQMLGVGVTVEEIGLNDRGEIMAHCSRGQFRQSLSILDLPLPTPPPPGGEWIEAFRHWAEC